ncbi:MAG: glycosyltransferase, partial [Nitrososphaeria archaeon]
KEVIEKGTKVFFLNKRKGFDIRVVSEIIALLREYKPDIVHTHRYALSYVLMSLPFSGVSVCIHTVHNVAYKEVGKIWRMLFWFAFNVFGVIPVSISESVASTVKSLYGKNLYTPVIYNGAKTQRFIEVDRLDTTKNNIVILNVARFEEQKNHKLLIEAFALLAQSFPNVELWLVGDGPLKPQIEIMVKDKNLTEKVKFLGIRSDIPGILACSDIFVLASSYEGFGLSVIEAMASKKPVVATNLPAIQEVVVNGETGILVPPSNSKMLAEAILQLVRDKESREEMGRKGQLRATTLFDISKTVQNYEALYMKLFKERNRYGKT